MITSFRHKGLKKLFEQDDRSKVNQAHVPKLRRIIFRFENGEASEVDYIDYH